jgi:chemotaxis protein MotB
MSSHGGESGRWMVSYADFLTLLFVLFVVLYSMGQTDVKRYKQMAESFKAAFGGGGSGAGAGGGGGGAPDTIVNPLINSASGPTSKDGISQPIVIEGIPKVSSTGSEVAGKLSNMLSSSNLSSEVSVQNNIEGVLISLSEKLLFTPGTADLAQQAYPVLDSIAAMVAPLDNSIRVIGYTDNTPPIGDKYKDNWELSFARANVITQYLIAKGIDGKRLIPAARGEYAPIFPNDTPQHRALNSRADIVIVYPVPVEDAIRNQQPNIVPSGGNTQP